WPVSSSAFISAPTPSSREATVCWYWRAQACSGLPPALFFWGRCPPPALPPAVSLRPPVGLALPRGARAGRGRHRARRGRVRVPLGGRVRGVRAAVTEPQEPRPAGGAVLAADELDRPARVVVGGVARGLLRLAAVGLDELVVVVEEGVVGVGGPVPHLLI